MLTIDNNPLFVAGYGGITITGSCSVSNPVIEWWYELDPSTKYTKWVLVDGTTWSIEFILVSPADKVNIRATYNGEYSNILVLDLSTNHLPPEPTVQEGMNEFDAMAYESDISRYPLESNTSLRNRTIDAWANPGSATREGLVNGIERELLLPRLDPFFFLSVRADPRVAVNGVAQPYESGVNVYFDLYSVGIQLPSWIVYNESINVDPVTKRFIVVGQIGSEYPDAGNTIKITNGTQVISNRLYRRVSGSEFEINLDYIDTTKSLTITYPYMVSMNYIENGVEKSVLDIKTFLESAATVVNEDGTPVPLVVWNNGYLEAVDSIPEGVSPAMFETLQKAIDNMAYTGYEYTEIYNNISDKYYRYVNKFNAKGNFTATMILPKFVTTLTTTPTPFRASYVKIGQLFNKELQTLLHVRNNGTNFNNLKYYAYELQKLCRMGIHRAAVDADEWNSDSPAIIGDNFVPSEFDGGLQPYTLVGALGTIQYMTLNQRKHAIKILSSAT